MTDVVRCFTSIYEQLTSVREIKCDNCKWSLIPGRCLPFVLRKNISGYPNHPFIIIMSATSIHVSGQLEWHESRCYPEFWEYVKTFWAVFDDWKELLFSPSVQKAELQAFPPSNIRLR